MKFYKILIFLIYILNSSIVFSEDKLHYDFFPENNLEFPVNQKSLLIEKSNKSNIKSALSENKFFDLISFFQEFWTNDVEKKMGKKLIVKGEWEEPTVSAYATRDDDNNPVIVINGGLARHPALTHDGMLLILCHELGHHLGGAPKSFRGRTQRRSWSSAEGQADYFATSKCLPVIFEKAFYIFKFFGDAKLSKCQSELCDIVSLAALSVGRVYAGLRSDWNEPKLENKDRTQVYRTLYQHPNPQCRVDTYLAGLKCSEKKDIPFDNNDHTIGSCLESEALSASRPQCWFNSLSY